MLETGTKEVTFNHENLDSMDGKTLLLVVCVFRVTLFVSSLVVWARTIVGLIPLV